MLVWPPLWSSGQSSWLNNADVLCFLWSTSWLYICYVEESRPPLWSSGQSSWLQIQRSELDSRRYQNFWEVVGLERGPHSLVSTIEEVLWRESSGSDLENRDCRRADYVTHLYPKNLALTSASGGHLVGITRLRTKTTELLLLLLL
jgi:hypothetical protein